MRTVTAADFSMNCIEILSNLRGHSEAITLTAGGEAVALLTPIVSKKPGSILGFFRGRIETIGDVVESLYSAEELEAFEQASIAQLSDPA